MSAVPAAFDETPLMTMRVNPTDGPRGDSPWSPVRRPSHGKIATTSALLDFGQLAGDDGLTPYATTVISLFLNSRRYKSLLLNNGAAAKAAAAVKKVKRNFTTKIKT